MPFSPKIPLRKLLSLYVVVFLIVGQIGLMLPINSANAQRGGTNYARDTGRSLFDDDFILTETVGPATGSVSPPTSGGFPVADIGKAIWDFIRAIGEQFYQKLKDSLDLAYKQALRSFAQRAAYHYAVKLASGLTGEKPLFKEEFDLRDDFDAAVGDFLNNSVGKAWGKDLCEPLDSLAKVDLEISARQILEPRRPACNWTKIRDNFYSLKDVTLVDFPTAAEIFNPEGNDLGILLTLTSGALTAGQQAKENEQSRLVAEGGYRSIIDPVTGQVRTPAGLVERAASKILIEQPFDVELSRSTNPLVNAADLFIRTFVNTFAGNLMRQLFDQGINPQLAGRPADFGASGGIAAAKQRFALLLLADFRGGGQVDREKLIAELSSCDTGATQQASANNCVIDEGNSSFAAALSAQKTIGQALADGDLHGDWAVGERDGEGAKTDLATGPGGLYSLRSITILRTYGIVPVGLEIAARYIAEIDRTRTNYTLSDLTDRKLHFNNPQSPFYHLIDTSWVLKAPVLKAVRRGPGSRVSHFQPVPVQRGRTIEMREVPVRLYYNADEQTCILEDENGNCSSGQWGYCTEYRNTWRIKPGKSCDAEWVSCQAYSDPQGRIVSYLKNTLDNGDQAFPCSASTAGCSWYCRTWNETQATFMCVDEQERLVSPFCMGANGCACTLGASSCTIAYKGFNCVTDEGDTCYVGGLAKPALSDPSQFIRLTTQGTTTSNQCTALAAGCSLLKQLSDAAGEPLAAASVQAAIDQIVDSEQDPAIDDLTYSQLTGIVPTDRPLRLPPDYLFCTDADPLNDSPECAQYALQCLPEEVDCELFTPVQGVDPIPVPAIVNATTLPTDQCPSECAGYDTFWEQPTFFDDAALFPVEQKFIPSRQFARQDAQGQSCSAEVAGCEEFTLEGVGGDTSVYYTDVVSCTTSGAKRYYSWQGSNQSGFQLRVWNLLPSNRDPGPCTNGRGDQNSTQCYDEAVPPRVPPGTPPLPQQTCGPETLDPNDDPGINPYCVQFIDENFTPYWRLASAVVESSSECTTIRRKEDDSVWNIIPTRSMPCETVHAGCRQYKGNDSFGYRLIPLGNTPGREDFSDGDTKGWIPANGSITVTNESPLSRGYSGLVQGDIETWVADFGSICNDPKGCKTTTSDGLSCTVLVGQQFCGLMSREIKQGERYVISFWAKTVTGATSVFIQSYNSSAGAGSIVFTGAGALGPDWQLYSFGPVVFDRAIGADERLQISIGNASVYMTNIELRETSDLYIIKDIPWDVPASCTDQFLGCAQYTDRDKKDWYFTQFSNLCREDVVGCTLYVDTHNSTQASAETFNTRSADTGDDVTVSEDEIAYWVDDKKKYCSANDVGCTMLGLGVVDRQGSPRFTPRYLKLKPDQFGTTMCVSQELQCQAYREANEEQRQTYFKDPHDRVCVRSDGKAGNFYCQDDGQECVSASDCASGACIAVGLKDVWYQEGSKDVCEIQEPGGLKTFVTYCDPKKSNTSVPTPGCYVKACDRKNSSCTALRDPLDPQGCNTACPLTVDPVTGEPQNVTYDASTGACVPGCTGGKGCAPGCQTYSILRDTVDQESCATTGINPAEGCVPFFDTGGKPPSMVSECWPGCEYTDDINGKPTLYNEDCGTLVPPPVSQADRDAAYDDGYRPGCKGLVPR